MADRYRARQSDRLGAIMATPNRLSRRSFLFLGRRRHLACGAPNLSRTNPNDVRIEGVDIEEEFYLYRSPIKFGGTEVDRVTLLNVRVRIRNRGGRPPRASARCRSATSGVSLARDEVRRDARRHAGALEALEKITAAYTDYGHPVEINHHLEPAWLAAADEVSQQMKLAEPIPKLCTLTTASPFDAALHDAYGKLYNRSTYHCYTQDF
jgi:hypothetical protein